MGWPSQKRKFCSLVCAYNSPDRASVARANGKNSLKDRGTAVCAGCGIEFKLTTHGGKKYCSIKCAGSHTLKANRRKQPRTTFVTQKCTSCGNEFSSWKSHHKTHCSNECAAKDNNVIIRRVKSYKAGTGPQNSYSRCGRVWHEVGGKRFCSRSRWEISYSNYLQWRKDRGEIADWEYEPHTFWFEKIRRGVRSYVPDFKVTMLDGSIEWHEVKGWMDSKSKTKIKRMAIYHPNEFLRVLDAQWFAGANKTFAGIVPGWTSPGKKK